MAWDGISPAAESEEAGRSNAAASLDAQALSDRMGAPRWMMLNATWRERTEGGDRGACNADKPLEPAARAPLGSLKESAQTI